MAEIETVARPGRRIASLYANYETQYALREWAETWGFDLGWRYDGWPQEAAAFDFHITLLVSTNAVDLEPDVDLIVRGGLDDQCPPLKLTT